MYEYQVCPIVEGRCADLSFRLAVYEAGHALTARAMGFEVLSVKMLPRPPMLESDKVLKGFSLRSVTAVLENRCIELFGGQIAEQHVCQTASCCSGDVARIDELTRLIAGIEGKRTGEDIWFELEDVAQKIFDNEPIRDAILPIAEFLHEQVEAGHSVVPGHRIEVMMDKLLAPMPEPKATGFLGRLKRRG